MALQVGPLPKGFAQPQWFVLAAMYCRRGRCRPGSRRLHLGRGTTTGHLSLLGL